MRYLLIFLSIFLFSLEASEDENNLDSNFHASNFIYSSYHGKPYFFLFHKDQIFLTNDGIVALDKEGTMIANCIFYAGEGKYFLYNPIDLEDTLDLIDTRKLLPLGRG